MQHKLIGLLATTALTVIPLALRAQSVDVPTMACSDNSYHAASTAYVKNCGTGGSGGGSGNVSTDSNGTIGNQKAGPPGAINFATLSSRAGRTYSPLDYGALGTNNTTAVGSTYGTTPAAWAAWSAPDGSHPLAWATNPLYGLTFPMTVSTSQGGTGTALTFQETQFPHGGAFNWVAGGATWEDPFNAYMALRPGMNVSGSCIAAGTTVSGWQTVSARQIDLIPGSTDWAGNTGYALNAIAYAYGNFYQVTTAGTSGGATTVALATGSAVTGGPSGTGTGITDGSVTWKFVRAGNSINLPTGVITLSQATSSACANGTQITFTIGAADLQAATLDWMGLQTAAYEACTAGAGEVALGDATYVVNHTVFSCGYTNNTATQQPALAFEGYNTATSRIFATTDLGLDRAIVQEAQTGQNLQSYTTYRNMQVSGPGYTRVAGQYPAQMNCLSVGAHAHVNNVDLGSCAAGLVLHEDHQVITDVNSGNNGCGLLMANYFYNMGNQQIDLGGYTSNTVGGICLAATGQIDSAKISRTHIGFEPFGIYPVPKLPNVTTPIGGAITETTFDTTYTEANGICWICGTSSNANYTDDTFINTGGAGDGVGVSGESLGNGVGGTIPAASLIQANYLNNDTFIDTQMGAYGQITTAMMMANNCTNISVQNDTGFWYNQYNTLPAFQCGNSGNLVFKSPLGEGVFRASNGQAIAGAEPLSDQGNYVSWYNENTSSGPSASSNSFLGLSAEAVPAGSGSVPYPIVTVVQKSLGFPVPFAYGTGGVGYGQAVVPMSASMSGGTSPGAISGRNISGVVPALDCSKAIGVVTGPINGVQNYISVGQPGQNACAQAPGNSLTAGTSGSPLVLPAIINEISNTPSGGTAQISPSLQLSQCQRIYNDGANPLTISLPNGWSVPGGSPPAIASGGNASVCRLSQNTAR